MFTLINLLIRVVTTKDFYSMINAISVVLVIFIFASIKRYALKRDAVEINFILFFSIGYLYYFLTPLLYFSNFSDNGLVELEIISPYIQYIAKSNIVIYGMLSVAYYAFFLVGYSSVVNVKKQNIAFNKSASPKIILFLYIVSLFTVTAAAYPIRDNFFQGYSPGIFEGYKDGIVAGASSRGTYVAAVSTLFVLALMLASQLLGRKSIELGIVDFLKRKEILIYLIFSFMMLSLGGRLYLVSHLISILVFIFTSTKKYISLKKIIIYGSTSLLLIGFYGVVRALEAASIEGVLLNLVQEPLYTSISLYSFLGNAQWEPIKFPILLITSFNNLLPSILFPEKANFMLSPEDIGYEISTPLGGFHFFVTLMINFGYIGALFIMVLFGYLIGYIESRSNEWFAKIIYSLLTGWCTFSLFRDPVSVSIVKNIFQYSIVLPTFVFVIAKLRLKSKS